MMYYARRLSYAPGFLFKSNTKKEKFCIVDAKIKPLLTIS